MAPRACPCTSGKTYADCCGPFHRGEGEPELAEALMRSRFSAFAVADTNYLLRTIHPDHEDRAQPESDLRRMLAASAREFRYMRLNVVDTSPEDETGVARVLFVAHVFQKGRDVGFAELSDFRHDGVGWRYLRGRMVDRARVESGSRIADLDAP